MVTAIHADGADGTGGIEVAAASGSVMIRQLQLPDRRRMTAAQFLAGHPLKVGATLGEPARV
jgi:methionyl-tRNA formyltransferase